MEILDKLRKRTLELTDMHHVMALMQWDQEIMMPKSAASERASQMATLSAVIHRKEVSEELGDLLKAAEDGLDKYSETEQALVRVMRRSYDQNTKMPEEFVAEFSRLTSEALHFWIDARQQSDFAGFEPVLAKVVAMSKQQAEYLGYTNEPYDALLDIYEEGLTALQVREMFAGLKEPLVEMIREARKNPDSELFFDRDFDQGRQVQFAEKALAEIGYDFSRGRQDVSTHPFSTTLGHNDRRVTNRYSPRSIEFIFSALHEGGHGIYEQGIDENLMHTALDTGVSLGIHESQSRLWENIIGRGLPFWEHFYPELQKDFPEHFRGVSVKDFVRGINHVKPGFIRVEADEVSYNLHVLVRFELERALIEGSIKVADLPGAWNQKYKEYLGVEVDSHANGVLQDIHWAHGSFGYFPTYTIGNLAAAQIWHTYTELEADYAKDIAGGNLHKVKEWLSHNIYRHGSVYPPEALLVRVTGEKLNSRYFVDYLKNKMAWLKA
ncbi:MAG: carboxypeptidase M32 [Proteobacteria bacterium]|nr:carboxypeptidase M32 [Pseudomonadota bacterium]MBU1708822.1 carboxypeptidase M32 [Pseudomonadota bacterium]